MSIDSRIVISSWTKARHKVFNKLEFNMMPYS